MSTTEQRTPDAEATPAARDGWAVPGVAHTPGPNAAQSAGGPATADDADPTVGGDRLADAKTAEEPNCDLAADLAGAGGPGGGHPVVTAVLACLEALEATRQAGVATLSAREIRLMLLAVAQIIAAAFALKLRLLTAGKVQRVEDLTGATSTAAFLAHLTQMRRPDAAAQVRLATDLDHRYRLLADALARGLCSPDQLRVCVAALRKLPSDLPEDRLEACQRFLIDACQRLTPTQLKTVGRHLWEVIDPDGADAKAGKDLQNEEHQARAKASIRFWDNGDGTTGFRGKLPHLQAAILRKALHALAAPRRRNNPNIRTGQPDDTRRNGTTDPDPGTSPAPSGNGQAEQGPASTGPASTGPAGNGQRADGGRANPDTNSPTPGSQGPPGDGSPPNGDPGPRFGDPDRHRLDGDLTPEERDTGRVIPYPVRLGHALMDLLERLPETILPTTGGVPATIVATITLDQLRTGLGTTTLDTGEEVSAGQLRRLACNAGIIPAVLDGNSQPLDLGRRQRLFTPYQRIALDLRDHGGTDDPDGGGCVIDGCDRPASVCEAHHPHPWEHGGETNLVNGILVCPYHHHLAHHPDWALTCTHGTWRFRRVTSASQ